MRHSRTWHPDESLVKASLQFQCTTPIFTAMWLININTRELELFNDERTLPHYAILSHTWASAKMTMQQYCDLFTQRPSVESMQTVPQSYVKIDNACRKASDQGLHYLWVDTCCNDKTSSAELSEAINSMFKWYQRTVAYCVFLTDVESYGSDSSPEDTESPCVYPSQEEQLFNSR